MSKAGKVPCLPRLKSILIAAAAATTLSTMAQAQTLWEQSTPPPPPERQAPAVEKNLKKFDYLDFDVIDKQKWDELRLSHTEDVIVTWPDGHETKGIKPHIADLQALFVWAPDLQITDHPIRFGSGSWTAVTGKMSGTFTKPLPIGNGQSIPPTGKRFAIQMVTVGHWVESGKMDHEWLFYDNAELMKELGLQ